MKNHKRLRVMWAHLQDMQTEFALFGTQAQKHTTTVLLGSVAALQAMIELDLAQIQNSALAKIPNVEDAPHDMEDK